MSKPLFGDGLFGSKLPPNLHDFLSASGLGPGKDAGPSDSYLDELLRKHYARAKEKPQTVE